MSTVLHPVGPQSSQVYWVRRLLVLLIAVVVVALVTTLLQAVVASRTAAVAGESDTRSAVDEGGGGGDPGGTRDGGPATADADPDAEGDGGGAQGETDAEAPGEDGADAEPEEGAAADGEDASTGVGDQRPTGPVTCAAHDLALTVTTDSRSYLAGAEPELTVAITNTGEVPCTIDAGDANRELRITSGSDRIWSTADCLGESTERMLLLDVGARDETTSTWPRVRSAEGCPEDVPAPEPGTYAAEVRLGGAESAAAVFDLE